MVKAENERHEKGVSIHFMFSVITFGSATNHFYYFTEKNTVKSWKDETRDWSNKKWLKRGNVSCNLHGWLNVLVHVHDNKNHYSVASGRHAKAGRGNKRQKCPNWFDQRRNSQCVK